MNLTTPWRVLRHYLDHPLGRRDRMGTLMRMLRWQAGSRLLGAEVATPFVDGPRLLGNGFRPTRHEPFARRLMAGGALGYGQHALRSLVPGPGSAAAGGVGHAGAGCRGLILAELSPLGHATEGLAVRGLMVTENRGTRTVGRSCYATASDSRVT